MNNKIKYLITTFLLFAFVGLFAQETINENNPSNSLGKKGAKMMLESVIVSNWNTTKESFELHHTNKFYYDSIGNVTLKLFSILNNDLLKTVYTYNPNNKIVQEKIIAKDK